MEGRNTNCSTWRWPKKNTSTLLKKKKASELVFENKDKIRLTYVLRARGSGEILSPLLEQHIFSTLKNNLKKSSMKYNQI